MTAGIKSCLNGIASGFCWTGRQIGSLGGRGVDCVSSLFSPITSRISPLFTPVTTRFVALGPIGKVVVVGVAAAAVVAVARKYLNVSMDKTVPYLHVSRKPQLPVPPRPRRGSDDSTGAKGAGSAGSGATGTDGTGGIAE